MLTDPDKRCGCGRGCATFGECLRNKNLHIGSIMRPSYKNFDTRLDKYTDARRQGVQPTSTKPKDVDLAMKLSQETGEAFRA